MLSLRSIFLLISLLFITTLELHARVKAPPVPPNPNMGQVEKMIFARAALLYDPQTNTALYQRSVTTPYPPASTVKLLTALLVAEKKGFDGSTTIRREDTLVEPSRIPLVPGETVAIKDLVQALLVGSDNDAALALSRHVSGNSQQFVQLMNDRAAQLGCQKTLFKNPNGLPASNQYTTARDLLLIFQKAISIPEIRRICAMPSFYLRTQAGPQLIKNHNKLLGNYPGMGPAKTGWTYSSRHTYAAAATRNGRTLHLVILNSQNKWFDAQMLFNYGFSHLPDLTPQITTAQ
jgi:serine-type D-Ala-D-Ala carboxypeptidase (penicillin-binding protein 5/6)